MHCYIILAIMYGLVFGIKYQQCWDEEEFENNPGDRFVICAFWPVFFIFRGVSELINNAAKWIKKVKK